MVGVLCPLLVGFCNQNPGLIGVRKCSHTGMVVLNWRFIYKKWIILKNVLQKSVYAVYMETLKGFNEETIYLND